jgi:hypothetical protein
LTRKLRVFCFKYSAGANFSGDRFHSIASTVQLFFSQNTTNSYIIFLPSNELAARNYFTILRNVLLLVTVDE